MPRTPVCAGCVKGRACSVRSVPSRAAPQKGFRKEHQWGHFSVQQKFLIPRFLCLKRLWTEVKYDEVICVSYQQTSRGKGQACGREGTCLFANFFIVFWGWVEHGFCGGSVGGQRTLVIPSIVFASSFIPRERDRSQTPQWYDILMSHNN